MLGGSIWVISEKEITEENQWKINCGVWVERSETQQHRDVGSVGSRTSTPTYSGIFILGDLLIVFIPTFLPQGEVELIL